MQQKHKYRIWQMQNNQQLNEGLRSLDLQEMIYPLFEIDSHRSKMGEDRDVCVITFKVKDRNPAKDVMEFIEKGFEFVLDSDVSSGENAKGEYFVFVELNRTPQISRQIEEITHGVEKLTGIDNWKFKYHKMTDEFDMTQESLDRVVPPTPDKYDRNLNKLQTVKTATTREIMTLIERYNLQDSGCGAIDMALLASALITENTKIWTQDKKLEALAKKLGVSFKPKLH